jgi:SSS family solute:Na+ symporter
VVVLPGICAAVIYPTLDKSDQAYPMMMSLLPNGLLGLTFAALVAAIVSSLASMTNSISTIFTMDIFRSFVKSKPSEQKLVNVGRNTAWISLFIAVLCAQPLLGFFTPGILVIFLVALFWKKATTLSVLVAAIMSLILSLFIFLVFPEYPFIHRMGVVFLVSGFACYITSLLQGYSDQEKAIDISGINFKTEKSFNISTVIICIILTIIYVLLW